MALWHWLVGGAAAYWLYSKSKGTSQYMTGGGNLTTQQAQQAAGEAAQIQAAYQAFADKVHGAGKIAVTVNATTGGVQVLYNGQLQVTVASLAEANADIGVRSAAVAGYGYSNYGEYSYIAPTGGYIAPTGGSGPTGTVTSTGIPMTQYIAPTTILRDTNTSRFRR